MKEHKSHMSMVARFAYIFATIVTIFAQIGAAVPAMIVSADFDANTLKMTASPTSVKKGDTLTISVSGNDAPRVTHWFSVGWVGNGLTFDNAATSAQTYGKIKYSSAYKFVEQNPGGNRHDVYVQVHSDSMSWPLKLVFKVGDVSGDPIKFLSMDYQAWPGDLTAATNATNLTVTTNGTGTSTGTSNPTTTTQPLTSDDLGLHQIDGKPAYDSGTNIDTQFTTKLANYPTQYRDVQFKVEANADGTLTNDVATFDPDATATLAKSYGFTVSGPVQSEDHTVYSYKDGTNDYNIWLFKDNSIRIEYPKGTTGDLGGVISFKAKGAATNVSLTPIYVGSTAANDSPVELMAGEDTSFAINAAKRVDGSSLRLNASSITNDNVDKTAPYLMTDFPLFYVTEKADDGTDLYSFVYNQPSTGIETGSATHSLENLRKSILYDKTPYADITSGAKHSTNSEASWFDNFNAIDASGNSIAGKEQGFDVDKTYTLIPYDQRAGLNHFVRISADDSEAAHGYYMPDGVPTFKVDSNGNITLVDKGDGRAKTGQWTADGKTINASLYKVKKVKVVDQDGKAVSGASMTLNTADGKTASMKATTGSDGTGDLVLNDYNNEDTDAFYFPNGTQTLGSLTVPTGYTDANKVSFSDVEMNSNDTLSIDKSTATHAKMSDDGQTLILDVWKPSELDSQVNIKKVDKDRGKALSGANFTVKESADTANDGGTTQTGTTLTSGDDGMVSGISVNKDSSTLNRTFHVTETKAPDGYSVGNNAGYDAIWTKGKGFTAILTSQGTPAATSDDRLVTVSDGTLVVSDTAKLYPGGNASNLTIEYVNAAQEAINGAQLPVLSENKTYGASGSVGISGVGGVVYNPSTDPATLKTPDQGLVAGGDLTNTSSMYKSTEVSNEDGEGLVQTLWSQVGLDPSWQTIYASNPDALNVATAMVNGTIPASPVMAYGLITPAQQARASMGKAVGYYSLGGTIQIYGGTDGKIAGNPAGDADKFNPAARDNQAKVVGDKLQVTLFKVKHVQVVDVNGTPIQGASVRFTNMASGTTTDQYGNAELVPVDDNGNATKSFIFPKADQNFVSAKLGGQDLELGTSPQSSAFLISDALSDKLYLRNSSKNIYLSADAQTVILKTNTAQAKTVINIHKQSAFDENTPVAGVTFKVTSTDGTSVTTAATDPNGDTQATFDIASSDKKYTIQEQDVPTGLNYKKDTETHTFTADATGQVTGVGADDTVISVGTDKVLHFADTPTGGGGVGDNGTNGGTLSIKKVDQADGNVVQSDATKFTITQTMPSTGYSESEGTTNGVATFKVGDPTASDKVFKVVESNAPDNYEANTKIYALRIQKDGTMTLGDYPALNTDITADHTADGTITFASEKDHTLVFRDAKKQTNNGFSIKKTEASDPTKGVTGNATFTVQRLDPTTRLGIDTYTVKTTDGTPFKTVLQDQSLTKGIFSIHEETPPSGYVADNNTYYFSWNSIDGVTGLTSDRKATSMTDQTIKNSAGQQVLGTEGGVLNFSDVKQPTTGPVLTVKKVIKGTTTGLAGATFKVTDIGNGNTDAPTGGDTRGSVVTPLTSTTDSNGTQQFSITATPAGTLQRVFEIVETKAPDGYALNSTPYYVTWNDTSGVGGVSISPTKAAGFAGTADGVATWIKPVVNKTLGTVNLGDSPNFFKIAAVQRTATSGDAGKTVGNVSIKLSDPTGKNGTPQTVTTDSVSGTVNVNTDTVAKALGLSTAQMTGSVDLRIDVSNSSNLTSPVSRVVRFTFPGSKDPAGFAVYGGVAAADSTNALKTFDGMVEDSKANGLKIASGDLDLLLRKDTLNAFSISDTNVSGAGLANVSYTVTFNANGQSYSKKVTTSTSGQFVLPDPNTLLGVKDFIAPGGTAQVTIKQNAPLSGYATNETTATLLYRTGYGYYSLMGDAKTGIDNTQTSTVLNGTVMSMQSILYYFGDSSINFYLTKELGDLNLASVPESMNFGQVKPGVLAQDYPLLNAGDANEAAFDTSSIGLSDPNVSTSEDNGVMSAKVIQQGTYDDGWKLQLLVGDLISEDKKSTVSGGSITFANYPTILKDDTDAGIADAGLTGYPSLVIGTADATDMLSTGPNAQAGTYLVNMNVSDVKINIPDHSGMPNTNYQAPMTWTIDDTPQTDVGSN